MFPVTRILICLSGGPDSVYAAYYLKRTFPDASFHAVYFNHGLRPADEIEADLLCVREVTAALGMGLSIRRIPVRYAAKRWKCSVEMAGRQLRYSAAWRLAKRLGYEAVVTGHHSDDNEETLALHEARGTESGAGIRETQFLTDGIVLWRPLLALSKADILSDLSKADISFSVDSSNSSDTYLRNTIRASLACDVEAKQALRERAELHKESAYSFSLEDHAFFEAILYHPSFISISRDWFTADESVALRRLHVLFTFLTHQRYLRALSRFTAPQSSFSLSQLRDILSFLKSGSSSVKALSSDLHLYCAGDEFVFDFSFSNRAFCERVSSLPFSYSFSSTQAIDISRVPLDAVDLKSCSSHIGFVGLSSEVLPTLLIRSRKVGDRFLPLGRFTEVKVSKYLSKQKVPKCFRDSLPLFFCDNRLAWIAYGGVSESFKVTPDTRLVLKLTIRSLL